jgi:chemotaxis protein CheD
VRERLVSVADWAVDRGDAVLVTLGLGSCVAVVIHDAGTGIGGLAHLLLPSLSLSADREKPAKFPETGVPFLVARVRELGAAPGRLRARLVGGASMFANLQTPGVASIGERNILATHDALSRAGVPVVGEDIGGDYGRSVYFHVESGRLEIRSYAHGVRTL